MNTIIDAMKLYNNKIKLPNVKSDIHRVMADGIVEILRNRKSDEDCAKVAVHEVTDAYIYMDYFTYANGKKITKGRMMIPSGTQRDKKEKTAEKSMGWLQSDKDNGMVSTWDENDMADALLSWFAGTCSMSVLLNIRDFDEKGIVYIYDCETKVNFAQAFIEGEYVFKVLKKVKKHFVFTDIVKEYIENAAIWKEKDFDKVVGMLEDFKQQRIGNSHKDLYLTTKWMEKNNYEDLLIKFKKSKVTIDYKSLTPEQEAHAFNKLSVTGRKHDVPQQAVAHLKACDNFNFWSRVYHNKGTQSSIGKHNDVMKKTDPGNNVTSYHYLKPYYQEALGEADSYGEKDLHLINLLLLSFLRIDDSGKLEWSEEINFESLIPLLVKWTRSDKIINYNTRICRGYEDLDTKEKTTVINYLCTQVLPIIFEILKLLYMSKYRKQFRPDGDLCVKILTTNLTDLTQKIESCRSKKQLEKEIKKLNLRDDAQMMILILLTAQYIVSNKSLQVADIGLALDTIIESFTDKYHNWLFSSDSRGVYIKYDGFKKARDLMKTDHPKTKIESIGQVLSILGSDGGFGLEGSCTLMVDFIDQVVRQDLKDSFSSIVTEAQVKKEFLKKAKKKGLLDADGCFVFMDMFGQIIYYGVNAEDLKDKTADTGHVYLKSGGNTLEHRFWILEERYNNRHKYKMYNKDMNIYYSLCSMKIDKEYLKERETGDIEDDSKLLLLSQIRKNMQFIEEYKKLNLDKTIDFEPTAYLKSKKN